MSAEVLETLGERVRRRLREEIRSGRYEPGTRLTLRTLARRMGTSVIPIRDALARLAQEGLVEGEASRGWRVPDYGPDGLDEICELREALECQAARLCALRLSDDELEELTLLARQVDQAKDNRRSNELEQRFHLRLSEAARSGAILAAIKRANVLQLTFGPADRATSRGRLHQRLMRAIATRDPDEAEREMRAHLKRAAEQARRAGGIHTRIRGPSEAQVAGPEGSWSRSVRS